MKPVLQVALDFINFDRAVKAAREAVAGGVDWIELGTPLIKSEGLDVVRKMRKEFPDAVIVADMKTMDAGRIEVESAAKAGANVVCVLGAASDFTIKECIEAGKNYGAKIEVDLIGIKDGLARAKEIDIFAPDYIGIHCAIDEQMAGKTPFKVLKQIVREVKTPLAVAGGINSETAAQAVEGGASVIIVGGAITKSEDVKQAAAQIKKAITSRKKISTELFKRVSERDLSKILHKVSTANLSDAMHRTGDIKGLFSVSSKVKLVGTAVTVRTYPGDWAKTVQAIDLAKEGDVIVIDAGGVGPAVWGELATYTAIKRNISGVVIYGAIRDTAEIEKMKFPAFVSLITPTAGEPKGFGEIGVPVKICEVKIYPGDWIVGDKDGLVVIPKENAVETANRAMGVLELEKRLRKEIEQGDTLSNLINLLKWEKQS